MQITRVEIRNFRSHVHTEIDLTKNHALVGMNGSGKTSVLEAINLATSYRPRNISEHDFNNLDLGQIHVRVEFDRYFINKVPDGFGSQSVPCQSMYCFAKRREAASPGRLLSEPFVLSLSCEPVVYSNIGEIDEDKLPEGFGRSKLPREIHLTEGGYRIIRRSTGKAKDTRFDQINLSNQTIGFPNVFYFDRSRERQAKGGYNSTLSRIAKELNWRYSKGSSKPLEPDEDGNMPAETLELWEAYYARVVDMIGKDRRKQLIDEVKGAVSELSGSQFDDLELSILDLEQPFERAFFARRSGMNQIEVSELGSGQSLIVAYCLLEHISKKSKEKVVFLFDEPELHLHPELQKRLRSTLRAADHQTVVTTHSPLMVDLGEWRSITRFDENSTACPDPNKLDEQLGPQSIGAHLDDIKKWRHHERVFFDADSELFFAQKVLLVEGPGDKYGLPRLASLLGKDISALTVVSCNGKQKICHYALLCIAFGVEAFVVFDLDDKPEKDKDNQAVLMALGDIPYVAFSSSFEDLLGVGANARRPTLATLEKIDEISADDVPEEIAGAINEIDTWYSM